MKLVKIVASSIVLSFLCIACKGNAPKIDDEEKTYRVEIVQVPHAVIRVFLGDRELNKNELISVAKGSELTVKMNSTDPSSAVYKLLINKSEYPSQTNGEFVVRHTLIEDVKITGELGRKYYRIDFDIDVMGTATIKFKDPRTGGDVKGVGFLLERNTDVDIVLQETNPDYECEKIVIDDTKEYTQKKNGFITANVILTKDIFAKGITKKK